MVAWGCPLLLLAAEAMLSLSAAATPGDKYTEPATVINMHHVDLSPTTTANDTRRKLLQQLAIVITLNRTLDMHLNTV